MNQLHLIRILKTKGQCRSIVLFLLVPLILMSCDLFIEETPLEFDKMQIQYHKYGGWINVSQLDIESSGEATATVLAQGDREVLAQNTSILTQLQKEKLAQSFASFSEFKRNYQPEKHWTDQDFHMLILSYEGRSDTVTVYNPRKASLPKDLRKIIANKEQLHHSILEQ